MDVRQYFQNELERKLADAKAITDTADGEGRPISDEENAQVHELLKDAADLKAKIKTLKDNEALRKAVDDLAQSNTEIDVSGITEDKTPAYSIGDAFVKSVKYKGLVERGLHGNWSTGPIEIDAKQFGGMNADVRAVIAGTKTTLTEAGGSGGPLIQPDVQPGIMQQLSQMPTVAALFAQGSTNTNLVRYLKETTATNSAAGVAEGAAKPESTLVFAAVDEPVKKLATFLPVSDEMLEDYAQIRSYIDNRLTLFVRQKEDQQLLTGAGTNDLLGLLDAARTGVQTQARGTDDNAKAIFKAMTLVRAQFLEPDAIVMHPNNWATVATLQDANGQYIGGGPFVGPAGPSLWGKPVVVTSAITANTALVGAFRTAAQIYRRSGLTVDASNSHQDFFQKNLTAIRAEERLAFAVYREAGFAKVTGLN